MLFSKKAKGVMKWVWGILVFLIIISMVLLYTPIFHVLLGGSGAAPTHQQPF